MTGQAVSPNDTPPRSDRFGPSLSSATFQRKPFLFRLPNPKILPASYRLSIPYSAHIDFPKLPNSFPTPQFPKNEAIMELFPRPPSKYNSEHLETEALLATAADDDNHLAKVLMAMGDAQLRLFLRNLRRLSRVVSDMNQMREL